MYKLAVYQIMRLNHKFSGHCKVIIFLWLAVIPFSTAKNPLLVERFALPQADIMTVTVPKGTPVTMGWSQRLKTVPQFVTLNTLAVLNAGFFDPVNNQTTAYLVRNGQIEGDPAQNTALTQNPRLKPYLPAIFNRTELRAYQCGQYIQYEMTPHNTPDLKEICGLIPVSCKPLWSIGGGPQLLPRYTPEEEAFTATNLLTGKRTRDPIGVDAPNARSAVALLPNNQLMLVFVGQTADGKKGMSLPQLISWLKQQGVTHAMALDGGSSTGLWVDGQMHWGKGSQQPEGWQTIKRPVKSVIMVEKTKP